MPAPGGGLHTSILVPDHYLIIIALIYLEVKFIYWVTYCFALSLGRRDTIQQVAQRVGEALSINV